jgi:hypothetical protein
MAGCPVIVPVVAPVLHAKAAPTPAVAVRLVCWPAHIVTLAGLIAATGILLTVTSALAVAVQLLMSVAVTEYVVVAKGLTVIAEVSPALLLHA